jgi:hypothetical protein
MDEQFEKDLNKKAVESYEIKTSASSILSAYHAKQEAQKPSKSYRTPFFIAIGAFSCAAIALAVVVPMAFRPATSVPSASLIENSVTELQVSPLKNQKDTLAYEVSSLYPLLKRASATSAVEGMARPLLAYSAPTFAGVVDSYETLQAQVRSSFEGDEESLTLTEGTFVGNNGTYTSKMVIPDAGTLLFSTVAESGVWKSLKGELLDDEETEYTVIGTAQDSAGQKGLFLRLQSTEEAGDYALVNENTNNGRFYFTFDLFEEYRLETHFSIRLMANGSLPYIHAEYVEEDETAAAFGILRQSASLYSITQAGFGQFLLSYQNTQRIYTFNGNTITK